MIWVLNRFFILWASTWRVFFTQSEMFLKASQKGAPVGLWHEHLIVLALIMRHNSNLYSPLVSLSRDGTHAQSWFKRLGYDCIRGSSSLGGTEAFDACLTSLQNGRSVVITMDGPRGPRRLAKSGIQRMSLSLNKQIWVISVNAPNSIRLKSWDKMLLPLPFSRVEVVFEAFGPTSNLKEFQTFLDEKSVIEIPRDG